MQHVTHAVCEVVSPHSLGSGAPGPESFAGGVVGASGVPASPCPGAAVSAGFVSVTGAVASFDEEHAVECRANADYEAYRARGRMKDGRRFGRPPNP